MKENKVFKVKILKVFSQDGHNFFSYLNYKVTFQFIYDFTNIIFFVLTFRSSMDYINRQKQKGINY